MSRRLAEEIVDLGIAVGLLSAAGVIALTESIGLVFVMGAIVLVKSVIGIRDSYRLEQGR